MKKKQEANLEKKYNEDDWWFIDLNDDEMNVYAEEDTEQMLEDDLLTADEEGFLRGYEDAG